MNQYRAVVIGNLGIEKQKKHALQKFSISSSKVKRNFQLQGKVGKGEVYIRPHVAHQAGAYPGFRSMKRLGVFLLPPGWDGMP